MFAIIIPTYNESQNISKLIPQVFKYQPQAYVLVADDNSPDGTGKIVKKLQNRYPRLLLLSRYKDKGRGAAVIDGFKYIFHKYPKVEYFMEMDADFSHDPKQIQLLINATKPQTIVVGSRYVKGSKIVNWPINRIILSHLANSYIKFLLGVPLNDFTNGLRCYSREAVKVLLHHPPQTKGFITLSETAYLLDQQGFNFVEVPITFADRTMGKSNATFGEVFRSLTAVWKLKFSKN